ncbi:MAG: glycosyltransferase family 4 protein [Acidimicrobiia bacterium]
MQIGLIAPPWVPVPPPSYGGTEEVLDTLATGLDAAGHDVLLFATGDSTCPVRVDYVYEEAERQRMGDSTPELHHTLAAYDALRDCDVIHDHTITGPLVAALRGRERVVVTNHGPFTAERRAILSATGDRVSVVAISHDQASRAQEVEIARVIHHGLDPDAFTPGGGTGGYLLFLGRMNPDKGVHIAARVARASGRHLIIAAKMEEEIEHRYFAEEIEPLLGDDVVYVGEMDRDAKKVLLASAEALLNPIRWPEPFGLVMIEALASGTPVIGYGTGSAPEIVDDGVTGFLCPDEESMIDAVARLKDLDRGACRRVFEERFTAQRMVEEHLALYEEIARPRKSTAA